MIKDYLNLITYIGIVIGIITIWGFIITWAISG